MDWLTLLVLAVGLAMDAMAVSAARGLVSRRKREAVSLAVVFGAFQAAMPALGWWLGSLVGPLFERWAVWIAAGLLAAIGAKMLWDTRGDDDEAEEGPLTMLALFTLGLATSIDAFAAGVSLTMLELPLVLSIALIGGMTAALSALGFAVGRRAGARLGRRLERFGGVILLLLAVKAIF